MNRDPREDEIEVELVMNNNTPRSKGGHPSLPLCRGGISDAQYECGFGISPHVSCTGNARLEKVRAKVRALDKKFNTIQSSLDAVMAKLRITVKRIASAL